MRPRDRRPARVPLGPRCPRRGRARGRRGPRADRATRGRGPQDRAAGASGGAASGGPRWRGTARGAGDSKSTPLMGGAYFLNPRGERKPSSGKDLGAVPLAPRAPRDFCHVPLPDFFPFCILGCEPTPFPLTLGSETTPPPPTPTPSVCHWMTTYYTPRQRGPFRPARPCLQSDLRPPKLFCREDAHAAFSPPINRWSADRCRFVALETT